MKAHKIVHEKSSADSGNDGADETTKNKKIAAAAASVNKKSTKCQAQLDGARTFYSGVSNILPVCNSLRQKPVFNFDGELNDAPTVKFGKAVKYFRSTRHIGYRRITWLPRRHCQTMSSWPHFKPRRVYEWKTGKQSLL